MSDVILSLYDKKSETYVKPYTAPNKTVAIRSFVAMLSGNGSDVSMIRQFPSDFELRYLGDFDPISTADGSEKNPIVIKDLPETLITAEQAIAAIPNKETE